MPIRRPRSVLMLLLSATLALLTSCGIGADQVTGRVGETIPAGDYQLTVKSMQNPGDPPDRFTNPKPGNRFVRFEMTVANLGLQHLPVAAAHFKMTDSGQIENAAIPGIPSDRGLRQTSVAPGQTLDTVLYFEMAANQQPVQLVLAPAVVGWRTRIAVNLQG